MSAIEEPQVEVPSGSSGDGWQYDKKGKPFIPAQGRRGIIRPQTAGESPQEALARDQRDRDEKPKRKGTGKTTKKPPPPRKADLRELEAMLAEAFRSPAMVCAATGDDWAVEHFYKEGPNLARNLVLSAEHNPWLRRKLEEAASGGDLMMKVLSMVGVAGAGIAYALPPLIYYLGLRPLEPARRMFQVPYRKPEHEPYSPPQPAHTAAEAA